MLHIDPNEARVCFIRVSATNTKETIEFIEKIWKSFETDGEFNYRFMDETLSNLYRAEQRSNTLINYFSFICPVLAIS